MKLTPQPADDPPRARSAGSFSTSSFTVISRARASVRCSGREPPSKLGRLCGPGALHWHPRGSSRQLHAPARRDDEERRAVADRHGRSGFRDRAAGRPVGHDVDHHRGQEALLRLRVRLAVTWRPGTPPGPRAVGAPDGSLARRRSRTRMVQRKRSKLDSLGTLGYFIKPIRVVRVIRGSRQAFVPRRPLPRCHGFARATAASERS